MFFKRKEKSEDIIAIIQKKGLIRRYFLLIIGCFLYALAFNTFFLPEEIVNGGVSGIATLPSLVAIVWKDLGVLARAGGGRPGRGVTGLDSDCLFNCWFSPITKSIWFKTNFGRLGVSVF